MIALAPTLSLFSLLSPASEFQQETKPPAPLAFEVTNVRRTRQRITYFGKDPKQPSPGQVSIEYGAVPYVAGDKEVWPAADGIWNAGRDYWSTLDVNLSLQFGNRRVKPGLYYVVADARRNKAKIVLFDADKVRKERFAFGQAEQLKGGIPISLDDADLPGAKRNLSLVIGVVNRDAPTRLRFRCKWGEREYTARVKALKITNVVPFGQGEARSRSILASKVDDEGRHFCATIEHSEPKWKESRSEALAGIQPGQRWRLGQNFWASLETNVPLVVGGKAVDPGHYYLMLERGKKKGKSPWSLVMFPAETARKRTMDGFQAEETKSGIEAPMAAGQAPGKPIEKLDIRFLPLDEIAGPGTGGAGEAKDAAAGKKARWAIAVRWGPHSFFVPVTVKVK